MNYFSEGLRKEYGHRGIVVQVRMSSAIGKCWEGEVEKRH